jgi:transcriptional regulator with XRE-family HTH domain
MENILKNIEAIRKEKRITQEALAFKLGIKQSSYSSFITRESDITYSRLLQISEALGVSIIDIITWPEKYILASSDEHCKECEARDATITNLNKYIELLEKKQSV